MIKKILFLLLILISLTCFSFVNAADIDNSTLDSNMIQDETPELAANRT